MIYMARMFGKRETHHIVGFWWICYRWRGVLYLWKPMATTQQWTA